MRDDAKEMVRRLQETGIVKGAVRIIEDEPNRTTIEMPEVPESIGQRIINEVTSWARDRGLASRREFHKLLPCVFGAPSIALAYFVSKDFARRRCRRSADL